MPRKKAQNQTEEAVVKKNETTETEAPKKRGRKKAAETQPATEKAAAPAAKKTRKTADKKTSEKKADVPAVAEIAEKPAPKKRGRKPAAEKAAADFKLKEIDEAPKKRGRKPAAKVSAPAVAEIAEAPAVKKKGRKPKAPEVAAIDEVPNKTRKSAEKKSAKSSAPKLSPFDELFGKAADKIIHSKFNPNSYFAAEITLTGAVTGKFYVKFDNGMEVMPYDYKDADLNVEVDSDILAGIIDGTVAFWDAVNVGKLEMTGRASIMASFAGLIS